MNASEAYETYVNGNISIFKNWLKKASKAQIATITMLWIRHNEDFLKLKSYILQK